MTTMRMRHGCVIMDRFLFPVLSAHPSTRPLFFGGSCRFNSSNHEYHEWGGWAHILGTMLTPAPGILRRSTSLYELHKVRCLRAYPGIRGDKIIMESCLPFFLF